MAHQVDVGGTCGEQPFQLSREPVPILTHGGAEAVGRGRAESRRRERHHIVGPDSVTSQRCSHGLPDGGCLGIAVNQHKRHVRGFLFERVVSGRWDSSVRRSTMSCGTKLFGGSDVDGPPVVADDNAVVAAGALDTDDIVHDVAQH